MMQLITYQSNIVPGTEEIIELYESAGLIRPTSDIGRIDKMYTNSNLIVTAWDNALLVGIARSLTDFCYCCYLSDLAVRKEYQKSGIGQQLIFHTQQEIGNQSMLLLLSAPAAMKYYPKVGMDKVENGFIIKRKK